MNTDHARSLALVAFVFGSPACGGTSLENDATDGGALSHTASPDDAAAPEGAAEITVAGYAVDKAHPSSRLAARSVVLLDSGGRRTALTTDATGAFQASGISPPYDALVAGADLGSAPIAYLGLSSTHPQLGGWTDDAPCTPRTATIALLMDLPACGTADCRYDVSLSSGGYPVVGGVGRQGYEPGGQLLSVEASWCGGATAEIEVNVLVSDAAYAHCFYAASPIGVTDGAVSTSEIVMPIALAAVGTTTLTIDSIGIPQAWGAPETDIFLVYPNGGVADLPEGRSASVATGVPDIAGATLTLQGVFSDSNPTGATATAAAKGRPLSTGAYTLTVNGPPAITSPLNGGGLSGFGTIAWTATANDEIVDAILSTTGAAAESVVAAYVLTSGNAIDVARLSALGVVVPAGEVVLELVAAGKVGSLDATVDGDMPAMADGTEGSDETVRFTFVP